MAQISSALIEYWTKLSSDSYLIKIVCKFNSAQIGLKSGKLYLKLSYYTDKLAKIYKGQYKLPVVEITSKLTLTSDRPIFKIKLSDIHVLKVLILGFVAC